MTTSANLTDQDRAFLAIDFSGIDVDHLRTDAATAIAFALDAYELSHVGDHLLFPQDFHDKANNSLQSLRDYAGLRVAGDPNVSIM
jgi:hypothetical protein